MNIVCVMFLIPLWVGFLAAEAQEVINRVEKIYAVTYEEKTNDTSSIFPVQWETNCTNTYELLNEVILENGKTGYNTSRTRVCDSLDSLDIIGVIPGRNIGFDEKQNLSTPWWKSLRGLHLNNNTQFMYTTRKEQLEKEGNTNTVLDEMEFMDLGISTSLKDETQPRSLMPWIIGSGLSVLLIIIAVAVVLWCFSVFKRRPSEEYEMESGVNQGSSDSSHNNPEEQFHECEIPKNATKQGPPNEPIPQTIPASTSVDCHEDLDDSPLTTEHRPLLESTDEINLPNENSEIFENKDKDICKFCNERFDHSHKPTTVTVCGHLLHTHCMNRYLPTKKQCPVCDHVIDWVHVTGKCVFCLEPFNWNGDLNVNPPCAHQSHQKCHKLWMCTTNDCPVCKETIYSRDACSVCSKPVLPSQIKCKSNCGHEYHAKCSTYLTSESDCPTCIRISEAISVTRTTCVDVIDINTSSIIPD